MSSFACKMIKRRDQSVIIIKKIGGEKILCVYTHTLHILKKKKDNIPKKV